MTIDISSDPMAGCVISTPRCKTMQDCCRNHLYDLLDQFSDACYSADARYMIDCGTLLGAIREGKIIAIDTDVDVAMTDIEFQKLLDNRIDRYLTRDNDRFYRLYLSRVNKLHVDIYIWHKVHHDGHDYYRHRAHGRDYHICDYIIDDPMISIQFGTSKYPATEHYEQLLTYRYGDWRTPITKRERRYGLPMYMDYNPRSECHD